MYAGNHPLTYDVTTPLSMLENSRISLRKLALHWHQFLHITTSKMAKQNALIGTLETWKELCSTAVSSPRSTAAMHISRRHTFTTGYQKHECLRQSSRSQLVPKQYTLLVKTPLSRYERRHRSPNLKCGVECFLLHCHSNQTGPWRQTDNKDIGWGIEGNSWTPNWSWVQHHEEHQDGALQPWWSRMVTCRRVRNQQVSHSRGPGTHQPIRQCKIACTGSSPSSD